MNTKEIVNNIIFKKLNNKSILRFLQETTSEENKYLYSNIDFIKYFSDKGMIFWSYVITLSKISMNKLFEEFLPYLISEDLHTYIETIVKERLGVCILNEKNYESLYDITYLNEDADIFMFERLGQYLQEYKNQMNYLKEFGITSIYEC